MFGEPKLNELEVSIVGVLHLAHPTKIWSRAIARIVEYQNEYKHAIRPGKFGNALERLELYGLIENYGKVPRDEIILQESELEMRLLSRGIPKGVVSRTSDTGRSNELDVFGLTDYGVGYRAPNERESAQLQAGFISN